MRKAFTVLSLLLLVTGAFAQVPIEHSPFNPSYISTEYFGPYAFPVPELLEGSICNDLHLEVSGDCVKGTALGDRTSAITFKASIPLWTDRAALTIWGEMHEWYNDTAETRTYRRVSPEYPLKGEDAGNVYYSLDMLVLKESATRPSIALRAATQSATGDKYEVARHYDAPGYFFDISSGKDFSLSRECRIRLSATAGFVCWQTDRGSQNDAMMLGAKASFGSPIVTVSAEYGQYSGLEGKNAVNAGDCPKAFSAEASMHFGNISPFIKWQKGINDWPFSLVRAGIAVDFDIL
ncbi:MAG: hypothetical protein Q4G10_06075 [Bacteroidia bacterium]|nr:hypothetical protein [Bacteroidia bacterium]